MQNGIKDAFGAEAPQPQFSRDVNFPEGYVLCVDKPLEWSSTDVVRKVKYALERNGHRRIKIGHAGTLDPLATGLLIVCIGRATKRVDELMAGRKEYVAEVVLGATTASGDLEHPVEGPLPWMHITREGIENALKELSGERLQTPPTYSAKKLDGRRAYEMARGGESVEMRQSLINIYEIELLECYLPDAEQADLPGAEQVYAVADTGHQYANRLRQDTENLSQAGRGRRGRQSEPREQLPRITIRVDCGKGTYIRSLAREIGEKLGSGGYLAALRRTRSGDFTVEKALCLEEIIDALQ